MTDHNNQDCGCGHDHNHEHDEDIFLVTDTDGVEHEMVMVYTFEADNQAYAVLLDRNAPDSDGVIFRIEEENDDAYLVSIEDDEEWNRVVTIYNELAMEEADGQA
ncbi:Uncharacterized protein conserved in bacteria [Chlamydia abortus]|uniref:DUF1292 domain-containing protein n=1 Tax=Paenibacillus residui TaxID=629724 RepID=A0ABW3DB87_9BACL|nr:MULTISPECIES: DUF1292 domain-containing protein [Paenibacillaceae]SHE10528.1 Uncharacterized protein conserved in bacteria [Chlamydia abortus]